MELSLAKMRKFVGEAELGGKMRPQAHVKLHLDVQVHVSG